MRPRFDCVVTVDPERFWAHLVEYLGRDGAEVVGHRLADGMILRLRAAERHVWSPALFLHAVDETERPWTLRGRFSPSSPVWTGFLAAYLALTCVAIAAACYGAAQMTAGEPAWAFWGVPIAVALAGFTYGAAFIGQGLGAEDMYRLRSCVDDAVSAAAELCD